MVHGIRGSDRGQALVEVALVLPLIVFGLIGAADMARAFGVQIGVQSAARVGAEAAVLGIAGTEAQVATHARADFERIAGVDSAALGVTRTDSTGAGGEMLVTVQATYTFRTLVAWPLVPNTMTIARSTVMRRTS